MTELMHMQSDLRPIGLVLKEGGLSVPPYQRSYAWKDENVLDLLRDLQDAQTQSQKEYFLGAMVLSTAAKSSEVVDGQQRLATCAVVLAAIRDYLLSIGEEERAGDVEREYLLKKNLRSLEITPNLKLAAGDHDFFQQVILARPSTDGRKGKPTRDSHRRLQRALDIATKHLTSAASITKDRIGTVVGWSEYLDANVKAIVIRVPSHANAFVVFETLNDRGVELSGLDLVKNHLLMTAGDRQVECQENWTKMIGILEATEASEIGTTFLRHYWLAYHGEARAREMFAKIRAHTTSKQRAIDLASSLRSASTVYVAMLNADSSYWSKYGDSARERVRTVNSLRMEQIRPLLLAVLTKFSVREVAAALRLMVAWVVRFLVVGGHGGGTLEKFYGDVARQVVHEEITTAKQLHKAGLSLVPTDKEFLSAFTTARVSQNWLARYYLRALERGATEHKEPELVPNENADEVTLEHVLPQSHSKSWSGISEEDRVASVKRIGNMVLLGKESNELAGNESFAAKRPIYQKSEYRLTKSVGRKRVWTLSEIEKRQLELARLAVSVWTLKV